MLSHFKELEKIWYQKLKDEGFDDIEDVHRSDRLLKRWTHFPAMEKDIQAPQEKIGSTLPTPRFEKEEWFLNHPEFENVCASVCKHGNSSFMAAQVYVIWEKYCNGVSKRQIGREMFVSECSIRRVLVKMKLWMQFLDE